MEVFQINGMRSNLHSLCFLRAESPQLISAKVLLGKIDMSRVISQDQTSVGILFLERRHFETTIE